jgi:hypothetical protein
LTISGKRYFHFECHRWHFSEVRADQRHCDRLRRDAIPRDASARHHVIPRYGEPSTVANSRKAVWYLEGKLARAEQKLDRAEDKLLEQELGKLP